MVPDSKQRPAGEVEPRDLSAAWIGFVALAVFVAAATTWRPGQSFSAGAASLDRIDPNAAPWHELTALPDIGESAARAIVEFRERIRHERGDREAVVFATAADLDAVRGIGPVTIGRIAPYLAFPTSPPTSNESDSGTAVLNTRSRSSGDRR